MTSRAILFSFQYFIFLFSFTVSLLTTLTVHASNGLNQIGFGAVSIGMGGADIATSSDTSALNTNPAGLVHVSGSLLDINAGFANAGQISHTDGFGNHVSNDNDLPVLGTTGFANHLDNAPITLGIGFFAQGGSGNEFNNLNTAFGTTDNLKILFRMARITPGVAWKVNEKLSVGASLILSYSDMEQDIFPDTSFLGATPQQSFFGTRLLNMDSQSEGLKLGLMYQLNDQLKMGVSYNDQVDVSLSGGQLIADMTALGLGKVTYRDVTASGINQPSEFGIGFSFQYSDDLLLAFEINRIGWSRAVRQGVLRASNPNHEMAVPSLEMVSDHFWNDQTVYSMGMEYELDDDLVVRAGYNYGENPIPDENLNPLLNATGEHHLTFGVGKNISDQWSFNSSLEWHLKNTVNYTNPALPFGPNSVEEGELFAVYFSFSRADF